MNRARTSIAVITTLAAASLAGLPAAAEADAPQPAARSWCTGNHWGRPRPIPRLEHQQLVAKKARQTSDDDFVVKRAQPTRLGVIALVTGDVDRARAALHGVAHVASWTSLNGFAPAERIDVEVTDLLEPVVNQVRAQVKGIPGAGVPALWAKAGAYVLTWKSPVPTKVRALAGIRKDGVEVRVVPRPFSEAQIQTASERVTDFLDRHKIDWSGIGGCASGAGLELGVPGSPRDLQVTPQRLAQVAGMRVLVVHEPYGVLV